MSALTLGVLIVFIGLFIWLKWDEKRKWKTVYEATSTRPDEVQARYGLLREKGIRCRLNHHTSETLRAIGTQGANPPTPTNIQLQVHRKDLDEAHKHLADYK